MLHFIIFPLLWILFSQILNNPIYSFLISIFMTPKFKQVSLMVEVLVGAETESCVVAMPNGRVVDINCTSDDVKQIIDDIIVELKK